MAILDAGNLGMAMITGLVSSEFFIAFVGQPKLHL